MSEMLTNNNQKSKTSAKPDMTPMVDLGFLLLTFFIYTTTFSSPNTMELNMPKDGGGKTSPIKNKNSLTLILGKDNRIFWYQEALDKMTTTDLIETDYSPDGIRKIILDKRSKALDLKKWTVIIKPSDDAVWRNAVDILDEMAITASKRKAVVELSEREREAYKEIILGV